MPRKGHSEEPMMYAVWQVESGKTIRGSARARRPTARKPDTRWPNRLSMSTWWPSAARRNCFDIPVLHRLARPDQIQLYLILIRSGLHRFPGELATIVGCDRFNGRLLDECLNGEIFFSLTDVREKLERWRRDYNEASRIARSTIERQPSLRRFRDCGPSPSRLSIRQARSPVKGSLAPGRNSPWTRPRLQGQ
jgi:hypothetical protein